MSSAAAVIGALLVNAIEVLKIGTTPKTVTVTVLKMELFGFTLQ